MNRVLLALLCLCALALSSFAAVGLTQCDRACKESSCLTLPGPGWCRVFEDTVTGLQTWHAWPAPPRTFAPVLKKHPTVLTGRTLQAWNPGCTATCSNADGTLPIPQECVPPAPNWKLNKKNTVSQRECTQPGA